MFKNFFLYVFFIFLMGIITTRLFIVKTAAAEIIIADNYLEISDWTAPSLPTNWYWRDPEGNHVTCGSSRNVTHLTPDWSEVSDLSAPLTFNTQIINYENNLELAQDKIAEEGWFVYNWQATDPYQNKTTSDHNCPVFIDRTQPKSILSGNLPTINQPNVWLNWQIIDGGPVKNIKLYYRFQNNDQDWQGNFTLAEEKLLAEGEKTGWFYFQSELRDGPGYYQFFTVATDLAGNEESWPLETSNLPISKINLRPATSNLPQITIISNYYPPNDLYPTLMGEKNLYPNLDFEQDFDYWLKNDLKKNIAIINKNDNTNVEVPQGEKMLRLTNESEEVTANNQPLVKYNFSGRPNSFYTLTFKYQIVSSSNFPIISEKIFNFDLCGNRGQVGLQPTDVENQNKYYSGWQTVKLNSLKCQNNPQSYFSLSLDEDLNPEDQVEVYIDQIELDKNLTNPRSFFKITSQDPEFKNIACTYKTEDQEHYMESGLIDGGEIGMYLWMPKTPIDNEVKCWLINGQNDRGPVKTLWLEVDPEKPIVSEEYLATYDHHDQSGLGWNYLKIKTLPKTNSAKIEVLQPIMRDFRWYEPRGMNNWRASFFERLNPYTPKINKLDIDDPAQVAGKWEQILIKRESLEPAWLTINYTDQALNQTELQAVMEMDQLDFNIEKREGM